MLEKVALPDERHAGDKRRLRIDALIANKHSVGGCNGEMLKKSEQHTGVGFFRLHSRSSGQTHISIRIRGGRYPMAA